MAIEQDNLHIDVQCYKIINHYKYNSNTNTSIAITASTFDNRLSNSSILPRNSLMHKYQLNYSNFNTYQQTIVQLMNVHDD